MKFRVSNRQNLKKYMIMKQILLLTVALLTSVVTLGQNPPFSFTKVGTGKQIVIFIPGFSCSGKVWEEAVENLKNRCTCYVLTMSGFAGVVPEENPSFESWKTQIASFIKDRNLIHPILVGHSMGGGLALAIASDYPELIKKIIVVDALPCLMALNNPNFKPSRAYECSDMINRIVALSEDEFARMLKVSAASLTTCSSRFEEIVNWGLKSDRKTYAKMYCDFSNTDLRGRLKNISVPSLIVLEPQFRNIEAAIKEQYRNLPSAQFLYANKGLHFIMFDDSEWFLSKISEFINE